MRGGPLDVAHPAVRPIETRFTLLETLMRTGKFSALAILIAVSLAVAGSTIGQDPPPAAEAPRQPGPDPMQEMLAKWLATTEPGPEHELLKSMVGTWNTTTEMWWAGPDAPSMKTEGTTTNELILGGRYVMQRLAGKMPLPDATGQTTMVYFEGIGVTGFDRYRNVYVGGWIDSMSTQMLTFRGTYNPNTKTMALYGEMDEPMMNMVGRTVKYETKFESDDKHVFTIYDLAAGDDYKAVRVTYTRVK
jgi:hypothetical protein